MIGLSEGPSLPRFLMSVPFARVHTRVCMGTCVHAHVCAHECIHAYVRVCVHMCVCMCSCARACVSKPLPVGSAARRHPASCHARRLPAGRDPRGLVGGLCPAAVTDELPAFSDVSQLCISGSSSFRQGVWGVRTETS